MKKLFAILLISLFMYNYVGYLVVFKTVQHAIKKEIKTKIKGNLDNKELTLIKDPVYPRNDQKRKLHWKEDNEFLYEGNMYDVVRQYQMNDTIYYYCINDTRERDLFAHLDDQVNEKMTGKSVARNLVKIFKLTIEQNYFIDITAYTLLTKSKATVHNFLVQGYVPVNIDVESPPPELS